MDRDQMNSINLTDAGPDAFSVIDKVQRLPTVSRRLMAIANALNAACRGVGIDPRHVLETSDNYLLDGDKKLRPEFGGAILYFAKEGDNRRKY